MFCFVLSALLCTAVLFSLLVTLGLTIEPLDVAEFGIAGRLTNSLTDWLAD